ncbi:decarboxylase [Rhodococcus sp. 14-2470-1a]|uniref:decarboxylase n=1 Tax=Rhodococcus sp. 14-2470-1a TaxID=2023150 RepID=UPI000B9C6434|nr:MULTISPECIES: decarboxylase [unclassified Rhodococcus (in: high G+C Gram-positive bacteria)]OZD59816.1 decarboxylase [Rhodococcus sp. 06-1059B-a]OZF56625.1 decarboxylase [Rhodococcus sp. 14-2470-1a]
MIDPALVAERFGTPAFVYDLDRVRAARTDLATALPEEFEIFYAVKANPHPDILRELRSVPGKATRAEISSTGELEAALAGGFAGADILYTGPGKTAGEIAEALSAGVRLFSVESLGDLRRIGATAASAGVIAHCLLRINSATSSASTSIRMTGTPSQFGFDSETIPEISDEILSVPATKIDGAHFYSLSNARDEESLVAELLHTIDCAATLQSQLGIAFELLDIGGGFAAPYASIGERPLYSNLGAALRSALDANFGGWREGAPKIAVESGRYLVGDSGDLVTTVVNLKDSRGKRFVVADAGINTFGGMSGLGRLLPVAVRPREDGRPADQKASLVGPLCTPGDMLGRDIALPALEPDDVVVVPNAGAYGPTASLLMFLGRPAPVEIVVRGGEVLGATRLRHTRENVRAIENSALPTEVGASA